MAKKIFLGIVALVIIIIAVITITNKGASSSGINKFIKECQDKGYIIRYNQENIECIDKSTAPDVIRSKYNRETGEIDNRVDPV